MERLEACRWMSGPVLPDAVRSRVSAAEAAYFKGYSRLLADAQRSTGVDLLADLTPPKHLYALVRVVEDCGAVATFRGVVALAKDDVVCVRRSDVEGLVRQGKLVELARDN
jgi:hypothetical protein